jgi:hypothetical protein
MDTNDNEKDRKDEWPDDDRVIYIPDAEYHAFMRSFRKLEEVQSELHNLKANDNNSSKNQSSQ